MRSAGVLSVAALGFPLALAAQQPLAAPPHPAANPIALSFKAFSQHYGGWLVAAFDSIPASKYRYRPTPLQQTVGTVAEHLENANYELCERFSGLQPPMAAGDSLIADTVKAAWPKDTLVARLKASLVYCDSALARAEDARLGHEIPAELPTSDHAIVLTRFLLAYVTDLAEHYSQIASYMRLNGMVPPSALPHPGH